MSCSRACKFWKATDGKWYLELGNYEYAYEPHECTRYGPFDSEEEGWQYVSGNHSNPGSSYTDDSGTRKPPSDAVYPRSRFGYRYSARF